MVGAASPPARPLCPLSHPARNFQLRLYSIRIACLAQLRPPVESNVGCFKQGPDLVWLRICIGGSEH